MSRTPGSCSPPPIWRGVITTRLRSFVVLNGPTGEGVTVYRRSFSASLNSPCGPSAKPGLLGVCVSRTSTFQGQLFHHRVASAGSYAPTAQCLPTQALEVRDIALPSFLHRASWRTRSPAPCSGFGCLPTCLLPFIAGFRTPPSKPGVRLSPHRAFPGSAFLARRYRRVRIPFAFALIAATSCRLGLMTTPGRLAPAALRPVAGSPGLRLLWRLRLPRPLVG